MAYLLWTAYKRKAEPVAAALAITIAATIALMELRSGPKFARTYALLVPFLFFFIWFRGRNAWMNLRKIPRKAKAVVAGTLAVLFLVESTIHLSRMERAFLSVPRAMAATGSDPLYFFGQDTYLLIFQQMLEEQHPAGKGLTLINTVCDILPNLPS